MSDALSNTWALKLVTDATAEPVTAAAVKLYARIATDLTAEDALIDLLVKTARKKVEALTKRQLITATWRLTLDWFPSWKIVLPRCPLAAITSIKYDDADDGTETTIDSADYRVQTDHEPGYVEPAYGESWPSTRDQAGAVRITYTAGYGSSGSSVPEDILTAIKFQVTEWIEKRIDQDEVSPAFVRLLEPYRLEFEAAGMYDD